MLDWLVEERFVRKCGLDEHFTPRWADAAIDEDEAWDDTVPVWALAHEPRKAFRGLQRVIMSRLHGDLQVLMARLRLASPRPPRCTKRGLGSTSG